MRTRFLVKALFVAILLLNIVAIRVMADVPKEPHGADAMWVEPSSVTFDTINGTLGNKFNVTVWLNMTEDIFAWQVGMLYNRTQLKCTRSAFTGGATSNYFAGHSTNAPPPVIDTSFLGNGSILASESCLGDDNVTGPQSGSLMWAEFQVLAVPTAGNLTSTFDITKKYSATTWVKDPNLTKITITTYNAAYEFIGPSGPGPLSASISPSSASVTVNQPQLFSSTVSGGTTPYTYQWFLNGSSVPSATSSTWTFSQSTSGTYNVYLNVTDSLGATAKSNVAIVTVSPAGVGFQVTFNQTGVKTDFTGTVVTIDGANYNLAALPASLQWNNNSIHTFAYQSPLVVGPSAEQYVWVSTSGLSTLESATITVTASGIITGNYKNQYYLTMATNPSGATSPSGAGWYDAGTNATVSTAALVNIASGFSRYNFTGWTTTDMLEITNPGLPSTTVLMDKAKTVTGNYVAQYLVTFDQTGVGSDFTGTVVTIDGVNYNLTALPAPFWWDNGSTHSFAFASPLAGSKQYVWSSTSGPSTLQSGTLTITASGSVVGNYIVPGAHSPYDLNGDGVVDGTDLTLEAKSFGAYGPNLLYPGSNASPKWNQNNDFNGDNVIDGLDLVIICSHFGQ